MFEWCKVPKEWKYYVPKDKCIRLSKQYSDKVIKIKFIELDGRNLIIKDGYKWDGPSGPTFDTDDAMEGSAAHDALWQLIMEGLIDKKHKRATDRELKIICLRNGMWKWRAGLWYAALGFVSVESRKRKLDKIYKVRQGKIKNAV